MSPVIQDFFSLLEFAQQLRRIMSKMPCMRIFHTGGGNYKSMGSCRVVGPSQNRDHANPLRQLHSAPNLHGTVISCQSKFKLSWRWQFTNPATSSFTFSNIFLHFQIQMSLYLKSSLSFHLAPFYPIRQMCFIPSIVFINLFCSYLSFIVFRETFTHYYRFYTQIRLPRNRWETFASTSCKPETVIATELLL